MKPKIIEQPAMTIVGVVGSGNSASDLDISKLWQVFDRKRCQVKRQKPQISYEVHVGNASSYEEHYCIVGVAVEEIFELPLDMFAKVLPASTYAVFTHQFSKGGFGTVYKRINAWLQENENYEEAASYEIQCYDSERFQSINDPSSELDIYIPIKARADK